MRTLLAVGLLLARFAVAEDYGFGRGTLAQRVASQNVVVNRAFALTQAASAASQSLQLAGTVAVGDLLLVHQTTVGTDGGSSWAAAVPGSYLFRRVTAVSGVSATLDAPLEVGFAAPGAQAVVVAEYSQLDIAPDAGLVAPPWDGTTGGILAVFVDGTLRNDGRIDASGRGYRAAPAVMMTNVVPGLPCDQAWAQTGAVYAPRGEGWGEIALGFEAGIATDTSGGAGGQCRRSGGGGGAGAGAGGRGGVGQESASPNALGGAGGVEVTTDARRRLLFGGGGGGGAGVLTRSSTGGAGGGIVYLRARAVLGMGAVAADGTAGGQSPLVFTGGGGGGAGGTVVLWSETAPACSSITAVGGQGADGQIDNFCFTGSHQYTTGPGGGGGGGRVWLRPGGGCVAFVNNGLAGTVQTGCGTTPPRSFVGAEPQTVAVPFMGMVEPDAQPFTPEVAPDAGLVTLEWQRPGEGEHVASRRPTMSGRASPGLRVSLALDGVSVGAVLANAEGGFALTAPDDLADGPHTVSATTATGAATRSFVVDTLPPDAPVIRMPAHRSVLSAPPDLVTGTGSSGVTVSVLLDGALAGESLTDDAGRWSLALDSALAIDAGSHTLDAWARRGNGPSSEPATQVQFTLAPALLGSGQKVGVGCGCAAAPWPIALVPLLALWRRRGARRR